MKKICKKIANVLGYIYGTGIALSLFLGALSVVGYIVALCIGGTTATEICVFIYKKFYPYLFIFASSMVLLGIIKMYLNGDVVFSIKGKDKKPKEPTQTENVESQEISQENTDVKEEPTSEQQTNNENNGIK